VPQSISLENLHDIVTPALPSWFPLAPGWYAVALALVFIGGWFATARYIHWRRNTYRRQALADLARISQSLKDSATYATYLPQLPQLVKRAAIAAYGRRTVAAFHGEPWLTFLNKKVNREIFNGEAGQLLLACSWQPAARLAAFSPAEIKTLQKVVRKWLINHHNRQ